MRSMVIATVAFIMFILLILVYFTIQEKDVLVQRDNLSNEFKNEKQESMITNSCLSLKKHLNHVVTVTGRVHYIIAMPEIKLPYNAVIDTGTCHIGVLINQRVEEGSKITITGIVRKGYIEKLSNNEWVKIKEVYFIVAVQIKD